MKSFGRGCEKLLWHEMTFDGHLDRPDTRWRFIGRRAISLHLTFTFPELEDQKLQADEAMAIHNLIDWVENDSGEESIALG